MASFTRTIVCSIRSHSSRSRGVRTLESALRIGGLSVERLHHGVAVIANPKVNLGLRRRTSLGIFPGGEGSSMTNGADFAVSRAITRHAYGAVTRVVSVASPVWAESRKHFAYRGVTCPLKRHRFQRENLGVLTLPPPWYQPGC
jgi:hypothetical protein